MPNTYNWTRLEPLVKDEDNLDNVVVKLVCGMTASDGNGNAAYIDTMHTLAAPDPSGFIPFADLTQEWAIEIADAVAESDGFKDSLDQQIEAAKLRPSPKPFSWQEAKVADFPPDDPVKLK